MDMNIKMKNAWSALVLVTLGGSPALAQQKANYEESRVPNYTLPELLVTTDGIKITSTHDWEKKRRPELLSAFASQTYGRTPDDTGIEVRYEVLTEDPEALQGRATSRQVKLVFSNGNKELEAILLLYMPNDANGRVPVFVGYNFKGNHSTTHDTTILYTKNFALVKSADHPDWERGCQANRWSYSDIIDRGYAVATMCYHDIFPDKSGLKDHSVVSLFNGYGEGPEAPDEWQAIGAWAWGSSRIVDYLFTENRIDRKKIIIMGHSRQGKAALWAGAQDPRFNIVISNNSGEGGAAISRREYGESIAQVSSIQPAWFCPAFNEYRGREQQRPIDQHQLIALMAPRPVYVASAVEDRWADPKGEYLGAYHSSPVYQLYGLKGLDSPEIPGLNQPIMNDIGYHIRDGIHDVTQYDWLRFMDFADRHFAEGKK